MTTTTRHWANAARDLRMGMRGAVALPGDDEYARSCALWNGAVSRCPALVARCESTEDVRAAVEVARAYRLPLSVRGGGHDWAGRALCDGIVVDLCGMGAVDVDRDAQVATVAGGATAAALAEAAASCELVAVTGTVGSVGIAGLTMGGGYGPLTGRFGMAADNLLAAEVVLADGRVIDADPELLWGLRGGGGNFGVVTSMRIRLHDVAGLLGGVMLYAWDEARQVLDRYARAMASAPDELTALAGVVAGPGDAPLLLLAPVWSGDPDWGAEVIDDLSASGTPTVADVGTRSLSELLRSFDADVAHRRHYSLTTCWIADLTPSVISTILEAGGDRSSEHSMIVLHHLHGAAVRVGSDDTAFPLRQPHFMVEILAAWEGDDAGDAACHRAWADELCRRLKPFALPGGYPNLLGPADGDRVAAAYAQNLERLRTLKRRVDPAGMFGSAIPLGAGPSLTDPRASEPHDRRADPTEQCKGA